MKECCIMMRPSFFGLAKLSEVANEAFPKVCEGFATVTKIRGP